MKPTDVRTVTTELTAFLVITLALASAATAQPPVPVSTSLRAAVMEPSGGVSAGHPLTAATAFRILLKGGNAFDAGVASMLAGGVLEQDLYSLGGEGLVLVYPRKDGKVTSIVGQGWAPHAVESIGISPAIRRSPGTDLTPRWFRAPCTPHSLS